MWTLLVKHVFGGESCESSGAIRASIEELKELIMTDQAVTEQRILDLVSQVEKTRAETLAAIAALKDELAAAGGTSPGVEAALAVLEAAVQLSDDDIPDTAPDA